MFYFLFPIVTAYNKLSFEKCYYILLKSIYKCHLILRKIHKNYHMNAHLLFVFTSPVGNCSESGSTDDPHMTHLCTSEITINKCVALLNDITRKVGFEFKVLCQ